MRIFGSRRVSLVNTKAAGEFRARAVDKDVFHGETLQQNKLYSTQSKTYQTNIYYHRKNFCKTWFNANQKKVMLRWRKEQQNYVFDG